MKHSEKYKDISFVQKLIPVDGDGHNQLYYTWLVSVIPQDDLLNAIDSVEYFLHPTFPHPYRKITTKNNKFALKSRGWGSFRIQITVNFKDKSTLKTSHYLNLSQNEKLASESIYSIDYKKLNEFEISQGRLLKKK